MAGPHENRREPRPPASALRERGAEVTRLEAFVDAAFAFAVTLLVISVDAIPDSIERLIVAVKGIPAFAASFLVVVLFWKAHASWSRRYGLDDAATTRLSLLLVFLVLVYVYPLKMLFSSFFAWISQGWLPAGFVISTWRDVQTMFVVYAVAWSTMGLVIVALYRHAWSLRDALELNAEERIELQVRGTCWLLAPATGLLSLALALLVEPTSPLMVGLPGMAYALMWTRGLVARQVRRRELARTPA